MRTGKTPQQKHINHRHTTIATGESSSTRQPSGPAAILGAGHRPACQAGGSKRRRRGMGGGEVSAYVCVCVIVYINVCRMGRKQERLTAVFFPRDKFSNSDLAGPVLVRGSQKR